MSNQKSIIGCGYIPLEMQAVCLKTNMNTNLGDIVYKIITAPYERVFVRKNLFDLTPKECKRMAVDVVDEYTVCRRVRTREPRPPNVGIQNRPARGTCRFRYPCRADRRGTQIYVQLCGGGNFRQMRCCILCGFG